MSPQPQTLPPASRCRSPVGFSDPASFFTFGLSPLGLCDRHLVGFCLEQLGVPRSSPATTSAGRAHRTFPVVPKLILQGPCASHYGCPFWVQLGTLRCARQLRGQSARLCSSLASRASHTALSCVPRLPLCSPGTPGRALRPRPIPRSLLSCNTQSLSGPFIPIGPQWGLPQQGLS